MTQTDEEILDIFRQEVGLQDLPIGFYLVRPDGTFVIANPAVRRLFLLPEVGSLDGFKSIDFYVDSADRAKILQKAIEEEERGWHLERELIHLRADGTDLYVEDFCRPLFYPGAKEIIGYYGCLVDRTKETVGKNRLDSLQEQISELTADIGNVLHSNASILLGVKNTLDPVLQLLAKEQNLKLEEARQLADAEEQYLEQFNQKLIKSIYALFEKTNPEMRALALHPLRWEFLQQTLARLEAYKAVGDENETDASSLRRHAEDVVQIMSEVKPGCLPKEIVREVQRTALDLQRVDVIASVVKTHSAVLQMDQTLVALRDFITSEIRPDEKWKQKTIAELLERAVVGLTEFANIRNVDILIKKDNCPNAAVICRERELSRAFANVLHNAIKYSWSRPNARRSWVTIDVRCDNQVVYVSFEDRGVPIPSDEIKDELIFKFGYRGRLSEDRHRSGTGIGLTDARRVARQHKGEVKVRSRPASSYSIPEDSPGYYDQPFITTVEFALPLAKGS